MCPSILVSQRSKVCRKNGYPFELSWFPTGNHAMSETSDWSHQYEPLIHRWVPYYFDTTLRWILSLR